MGIEKLFEALNTIGLIAVYPLFTGIGVAIAYDLDKRNFLKKVLMPYYDEGLINDKPNVFNAYRIDNELDEKEDYISQS
jgi:hypothetical protein